MLIVNFLDFTLCRVKVFGVLKGFFFSMDFLEIIVILGVTNRGSRVLKRHSLTLPKP